jgi:hypothetical protein
MIVKANETSFSMHGDTQLNKVAKNNNPKQPIIHNLDDSGTKRNNK